MTDIRAIFRTELSPYPNRLARSILIALLCGLVVLASKTLLLPETAISAYLIFFASKEDSELSIITGIGLILISFVAIALVVILIMLSSDTPLLRILIMFTIAFSCMYLAEATSAGAVIATLGMVFFEILSSLDYVPFPDLVLRGLFWILPMVIVPMALLVIANLLFGRPSIDILSAALTHRFELIRISITNPQVGSFAACRHEFLSGNAHLAALQRTALMSGRLTKNASKKAAHVQDVTMRLLSRCASGAPPDDTPDNRNALKLNFSSNQPPPEDPLLLELDDGTEIGQLPKADSRANEKKHLETMRFAVKSTIAIAICYAIFILLHWPAIHTITITAFLVCLGTSDETLHKAMLRLTGCLIGSIISFFCLIVIIPNLNNAAELAVLTVLVALPAAWISVGRENSAYIGMQIALVFFLCVLNTTGPSVDLGIAWGRIVGIVLGNIVVAGVFLTLWPRSSLGAIEARLGHAITILATIPKNVSGQGLRLGNACDALIKAGEALTRINQSVGLNFTTAKRARELQHIHSELENIAVSASLLEINSLDKLTQLRNRL